MLDYQPKIETISLQNFPVDVLRLDLIDPEISGNKWFKLKYNLQKAVEQKHKTVLTFGGTHSNHIAATAKACAAHQLKSIGVIRSYETNLLSPTLIKAQENGMEILFVSPKKYAEKTEEEFINELKNKFGNFYLIPEGGFNKEGILGCAEILNSFWNYDTIFCACGTGATIAGLITNAKPNQKIIGINVLKGENTLPEIVSKKLKEIFPLENYKIEKEILVNRNHVITNLYAFSGYAKFDLPLIEFKTQFENQTNFELDFIYTTKLFFAVNDLIPKKYFSSNKKILVIHTGGLQGNEGFRRRYKI